MGSYIKINNNKLYVETFGNNNQPVLLYIHGGPGGVGVYDFVLYQGERLSNKFRVIAPEQRGIWRSEAVMDEIITLDDIVEDYEELRKKLNIKKWSILSHSFGGYVAVLYATKYPHSIDCMIFENPIFDFLLTDKSILLFQLGQLEKKGEINYCKKVYEQLESKRNYDDISFLQKEASLKLGKDAYNYLWFKKSKEVMDKITRNDEESYSLWKKSLQTRKKVLKDESVYNGVLDRLYSITNPCLLIKGKHDVMTCQTQQECFIKALPQSKIMVFENSSHWVRIEQPQDFCQAVEEFVYDNSTCNGGVLC